MKYLFLGLLSFFFLCYSHTGVNAQVTTFSDDFESYAENYSIKNSVNWDDCSLGGGTWEDAKIRYLLGVEGWGKELSGATSSAPSGACAYTTKTTGGNVSMCFNYRQSGKRLLTLIEDTSGNDILFVSFGGVANHDITMGTTTSDLIDTTYDVPTGSPTGASVTYCQNIDMTLHKAQLVADGVILDDIDLTYTTQPNKFHLGFYNYGDTTNKQYIDNFYIYSTSTIDWEGEATE